MRTAFSLRDFILQSPRRRKAAAAATVVSCVSVSEAVALIEECLPRDHPLDGGCIRSQLSAGDVHGTLVILPDDTYLGEWEAALRGCDAWVSPDESWIGVQWCVVPSTYTPLLNFGPNDLLRAYHVVLCTAARFLSRYGQEALGKDDVTWQQVVWYRSRRSAVDAAVNTLRVTRRRVVIQRRSCVYSI